MRSLIILVLSGIWNERHARIFNRKELVCNQLLQKIKNESGVVWIMAGAKHLAILTCRQESFLHPFYSFFVQSCFRPILAYILFNITDNPHTSFVFF